MESTGETTKGNRILYSDPVSALPTLLARIQDLCSKERSKAGADASDYNIFRIVDVAGSEIVHSAFLAHLLNPLETHGRKDLFLSLFLKEIGIDGFASERAVVLTEHHIGSITETYGQGGRIDIVISDRALGREIYLENKLYAKDQQCQILRYHNHNPRAHILYLTLCGSEASRYSLGNLPPAYQPISYREHIVRWLKVCLGKVGDVPSLREILRQYLALIESLTGTNRSDIMNKNIVDEALKNPTTQEATFALLACQNQIRERFVREHIFPLLQSCAELAGLKFEGDDSKQFDHKSNWGWSFESPEWSHVRVRFMFSGPLCRMIYGVAWRNGPQPDLMPSISTVIPAAGKTQEWWPCYFDMTSFAAWNDGFFQAMCDESSQSRFRDEINHMAGHMKGVAASIEAVLANAAKE